MEAQRPPLGQLMTTREVANMLRVKETTVTLWLRRGLLKGIKVRPHIWRITREAVEEFIGQ